MAGSFGRQLGKTSESIISSKIRKHFSRFYITEEV
jgi:hypothetical protein